MSDTRIITFCVTIRNRTRNFLRLLDTLGNMQEKDHVEVVVTDYRSSDGDLKKSIQHQGLEVTLITVCNAPFNRSQGRNLAAKHSRDHGTAILFFLDADMLVPRNFTQEIRNRCQPGRAWFPICYSLHYGKPPVIDGDSKRGILSNGWWRKEGTGNCGFTHDDFWQLGGWDEQIGRDYGKEDGDICRRAGEYLLVHRDNCPGLFHVWHPVVVESRPRKKVCPSAVRGRAQVQHLESPLASVWTNWM